MVVDQLLLRREIQINLLQTLQNAYLKLTKSLFVKKNNQVNENSFPQNIFQVQSYCLKHRIVKFLIQLGR